MTGKAAKTFTGFQGFPGAVGTLNVEKKNVITFSFG